jgi:hypothetical protein
MQTGEYIPRNSSSRIDRYDSDTLEFDDTTGRRIQYPDFATIGIID